MVLDCEAEILTQSNITIHIFKDTNRIRRLAILTEYAIKGLRVLVFCDDSNYALIVTDTLDLLYDSIYIYLFAIDVEHQFGVSCVRLLRHFLISTGMLSALSYCIECAAPHVNSCCVYVGREFGTIDRFRYPVYGSGYG